MAYASGNPVLVANETAASVTVGATTVASGKAALCTPTDCATGTLGAGLTAGTPVTTLTVSALGGAVAAGTVIDITQTISGTTYKDQALVTAAAAAAATSLTVASYTPSASFTTSATYTTSSQGQVAGAVEMGACVLTSFVSTANLIDSEAQQMEKAAHFAESMARIILSAGSDTWGDKGL